VVGRQRGEGVDGSEIYVNDGRGWSLYPFGKEGIAHFSSGIYEGIIDIHLVSIEPGSIRGNHYHMNKEEHLIVFGGKAVISTSRYDEPESLREIEIDGKTPFHLKIDQGFVHAIKNTGNLPVYLFCYSELLNPREKPFTVFQTILS